MHIILIFAYQQKSTLKYNILYIHSIGTKKPRKEERTEQQKRKKQKSSQELTDSFCTIHNLRGAFIFPQSYFHMVQKIPALRKPNLQSPNH